MTDDEHPRPWARRDRTAPRPPAHRFARDMRATPTDAERKLWWHLRYRLDVPGSHFRRQVRFGRYIADFACHDVRLVIEVDGGQHAEPSPAEIARTQFIEAQRYRVLRFWNHDVLRNIDRVLEVIQAAVLERLPKQRAEPPR